MACKAQPVTCRRDHIAPILGLRPGKEKPWQFSGQCPVCGHGGFSVGAPASQGPNAPRHLWHCNCHRDMCDPADARDAMLKAGISADCLGTYERNTHRERDGEAARVRTEMAAVLADPKIRALADLKLRMAEVVWGEAPPDWAGFLAFAERAGVQRSKRYEAAYRWGRRQRQ